LKPHVLTNSSLLNESKYKAHGGIGDLKLMVTGEGRMNHNNVSMSSEDDELVGSLINSLVSSH
jgi:hypothetical protein